MNMFLYQILYYIQTLRKNCDWKVQRHKNDILLKIKQMFFNNIYIV